MPSDTVWVALIGGSVTVASLGVQGWLNRGAEKRRNDREDRQRVEDRQWATAQERRDHYAELLRVADSLATAVYELTYSIETESDDYVATHWGTIRDLMRVNQPMFMRSIVASPSPQIVQTLQTMRGAASRVIDAVEAEDWDFVDAQSQVVVQSSDKLIVEIRRDLGYDTSSSKSLE